MNMHRIWQFDPTLIAIFGGTLTATFALLPLNTNLFLFLLNYLSAIPLYLVVFRGGTARLILASLCALGLFTAKSGLHQGFLFFITILVPTFLIIHRTQKGDTSGFIVSWITGLSIFIFLGTIGVLSAQSPNVLGVLQSWFSLFAEEIKRQNVPLQIIQLFPGISAISWIIMCLVNASLAQRLAIRTRLVSPPNPTFNTAQVSENWDIILALSLLMILTDSPLFAFIGKNVALMTCAPLFLVGLSVVNTWLRQFGNPRPWMAGIIFMSFLLVWPGIVIVILGILEPTVHLRQKWAHHKLD